MLRLDNPKRGEFALAVALQARSRSVKEAVIVSCWAHDPGPLRRAFMDWTGADDEIEAMQLGLRSFRFNPPAHLRTKTIKIYRGVNGLEEMWPEYSLTDEQRAGLTANGLSWTTRKEVAAFFACIFGSSGIPFLVSADCPVSGVLLYADNRQEYEVIPDLEGLENVKKCGSVKQWTKWAGTYQSWKHDGKKQLEPRPKWC